MTSEVVKIPVEESPEAGQVKEQPACTETIEELQQQIEKYKDRGLRRRWRTHAGGPSDTPRSSCG